MVPRPPEPERRTGRLGTGHQRGGGVPRYSRPAVRLWLVSDRAQVAIVVWDSSPQPPVCAEISGDAENGRGLLLVEAMSEQWGYCFPSEQDSTFAQGHAGKVVWAVVRLSHAGPRLWAAPDR